MSSFRPDERTDDRVRRRVSEARAWVLKNVAFALGDRLVGQRMIRRLRRLERVQWWEPERIRGERDRILRRVVDVAYREVPLYRDLYDAAGVQPEEIRTAEDLRALPIVTKARLRREFPDRTTRDTGRRTYDAATSGSTGKKFYVRQDAETAGWYRASFLLALQWAGWRFGEPHLQMGMTDRSLDRRLKDFLLRTHYASAARLDDRHLDAHLELLESRGIRHVWGYPGSAYCLARRARKRGWNRRMTSVVTWGHNLLPRYRREIEAVFGCRVHDTYGCAEGMHVAAQCGADARYHLHELDTVAECVDERGEAVEPGKTGAFLLTRLHPGPMPLVRYRVGDVGVLADPAERCPCGRGLALLVEVQGRDTDIVVTPSGNRLLVHYFIGVLDHFPQIDEFQVVQDEVESIRLRIVPGPGFSADTSRRVVAALRQPAPDLRVDLETVDRIPLTAGGKRRFVISRVPA